MATSDEVVQEHLFRWAEDLIDTGRRNRLLFFRHTRSSSFEFTQDALTVEAGLANRRGWGIYLPPDPSNDREVRDDPVEPAADELVVSFKPTRSRAELDRGLKTLKSRADAEFLDAGVWVLYLGLGLLHWVDVDDIPAQSPLLLVPVRLTQEGPDKRWRLRHSDDGEPALNPALAVKLERDFEIHLPTIDDLDEPDVDHVIGAVTGAVEGSKWSVDPTVVLSAVTFQKEVIYRDLQRNAGLIAAHPTVRLLAEGPSSRAAADLAFDPEPEDSLDDRHPPEDLACVLDADVTQRQCLLAARAGRSFVVEGPPGTGKSQTIANVIAQLLRDGKTVLFVSEKAAALDVVQRRLASKQLGEFALSLHSQSATRKAVAQELGRALDERPTATPRFDATKRARLVKERSRLSAYAKAVNEVRQPFDRSLHEVTGRITQLGSSFELAVPEVSTVGLTAQQFADLLDAAEQMSRSWSPVRRGDQFLWRDLARPEATASRLTFLRRNVEACAQALRELRAVVEAVSEELRLPPSTGPAAARRLVALLQLLEERPAVGVEWLTTLDREPMRESVRRVVAALRSVCSTEEALDAVSPSWNAVDPAAGQEIGRAIERLSQIARPLSNLDYWNAEQLGRLATSLRSASESCAAMRSDATALGAIFAVRRPVTVGVASRLSELGQLAESPNRPESDWLDPSTKDAVSTAISVLAQLSSDYAARREAAQLVFNDTALTLDLRSLRTRFLESHRGIHKLSREYHDDRKALAAGTVVGKVSDTVIARLADAISWQAAATMLAEGERRYAPAVGSRYYPSRSNADLDAARAALAIADRALLLAGTDVEPGAVGRQLGAGSDPDARIGNAAVVVGQATQSIRRHIYELIPSAHAFLEELDIDVAVTWCRETADCVAVLADQVANVGSAIGWPATVAEAREIASQRLDVAQQTEIAASEIHACRAELGPLAAEPTAGSIESAAAWVEAVREFFEGPVRRGSAAALMMTGLAPSVIQTPWTAYDSEARALFGEFDAAYGAELRSECDLSFDVGEELLEALRASVGDIQEWATYAAARKILVDWGWEQTIGRCETQIVPAAEVSRIVERAILTRWADEVIDSDPRLEPRRSIDRDEVLRAFRSLDLELVTDSAAGVINACTARRPKGLVGGAGVIKKEALKQKRHKPVRRLLGEAGEAAQKLKPCFMMSPLSVSQFLPPSIRFDVVIFDEASQVREADAICSIYRGSQVIIAGDGKQLPPTDFFATTLERGDEEVETEDGIEIDEFESVLERAKAQGFPALPLRWHYRSRHESLIAFSNQSFYEGRLHTFPGATFEAADLGVELIHVDGMYRRGTSRDNPVEAEKVVDRILEHRRRRPELTIGVVTLSSAQQACIEVAIERRQEHEPELAELAMADRLDGFFVKNLENVQGDERDLIIMSIGYGPDENGKLTMNFGPMNREGGWRRLNVAVTRARQRVEVISSVTAGQIHSDRTSLRHLARYLDYAERGIAALSLDLDNQGGDAESPFEEAVLRAVAALGYEVVPQVGVAGYRIDIGIRHPTEPGRYLLGVECDGYTYHSSKVARDRDRLRQTVLTGLGWNLHRIWSTGWFLDQSEEMERLRRVIAESLEGRAGDVAPARSESPEIEISIEEFDFDEYPEWAYKYEAPDPPQRRLLGLQFAGSAGRAEIARQIVQVVRDAGPIHEDLVLGVIREAWGIGRVSGLFREAFGIARKSVAARGEIVVEGPFLRVPGQDVFVRVPAGDERARRKVGHVPPSELDAAVVSLLRDAGPSDPALLRTAWARLFGWGRVGAEIEVAFDDAIDRLAQRATIHGTNPIRVRE